MDQEYWVDSEPPARRNRPAPRGVNPQMEYRSRMSPFLALFVFVPTLLFLLLIQRVSDALSKSFMGRFWDTVHPWLVMACAIMLVISGAIVAWHMYQAWHRLMIQHYERKARRQQLQLAAEAHADAQARENERLEIEREKSASDREIALEKIRLEQMRATLEHERLMAAQRALVLSAGQTVIFPEEGYRRIEGQPAPTALNGRGQAKELAQRAESRLEEMEELQPKEDEKPIPVPVAPGFWDMVDLITTEYMPLCFVVDTDPRSRTYMQTIPAFGTILDLLSLCIIGKPGRGKSVSLLYYICILAKYGAEIFVLDPQGAFKELQLLHGKPLPAMPPTARIYYYSDLEEMEQAVEAILGEIRDREKLYKPHVGSDGELKLHTVKHPLVILADELPVIAEMDAEIRSRTKEENKARKEEGLDKLEIRQVTQVVKTAVLAARKYGVYFVGASQSIDATILPTRVSAGFNSRIVFYSEVQKARMAGLESDVAKRLLPVIRRAGPGMTIYDCSRWDEPLVAAFPNVTIEDVLQFFGISLEELKALWVAELSEKQSRVTGPLTVDASPVITPKKEIRRATLDDAIEVWNSFPFEIGRPRLREELQARGLECSDDLAKNLLRALKHRLATASGAGAE